MTIVTSAEGTPLRSTSRTSTTPSSHAIPAAQHELKPSRHCARAKNLNPATPSKPNTTTNNPKGYPDTRGHVTYRKEHTMKHPTHAVIAIQNPITGAVLLTKRAATLRLHPGEYCFPGGRIEDGETSLDAALRELLDILPTPQRRGIPSLTGEFSCFIDSCCCPSEVNFRFPTGLHHLRRLTLPAR